jgi:16S rRNA (adenine1518-N6/adenine1519-N6)-dimethyltransferase
MLPIPLNIPDLLRRYNLRPDKRLGQNFLVDQAALQRIIQAAEIEPGDTVLEIGPGLGSLTCLLAQYAQRVVAVEIDKQLIPALGEVVSGLDNVEIVTGDILAVDVGRLIDQPGYLVVANIPYYITSAVIRHLLETRQPPRRLTLTVQREVAERICATAGEMSLLSLSVQVYGKPFIAARIPAGAFYPAPKVDSAVVRVDLFPEPFIAAPLLKHFFRLAKAGFSQKRKTLRNALSGGMRWSSQQTQQVLEKAGIDPQRRAETLSLEEWQALVVQTQTLDPTQQSQA